MLATHAQCPGENELLAYLRHSLPPEQSHRLERHFDGCPACHHLCVELLRAGARIVERPILTSGKTTLGPVPQTDEDPGLAPGSTVGRYTVLERLGEGRMGIVFAAFDRELSRKVALKLSRRPTLSGSSPQLPMVAEAKALARLSHPNVVAVYDVGQHDLMFFLTMELIDGLTLRSWLETRPRSWGAVLNAFLSAGKGLAAAHAAGLVHRDFKPENVLVARDGRVRVTDFGLALERGSSRAAEGSGAGTPAYMAPEQLEGAPADVRSDQYAFGLALYEALCGARPFGAGPVPRLLERMRAPLAFPRTPALPARLRRALTRSLAPESEQRFPSLASLLAELRASRRTRR